MESEKHQQAHAGNRLHGSLLEMMNNVGLQYPNYDIYNNRKSRPFNKNNYPEQPYQTTISTQVIEGCHFENQPQIPSPFLVFQPGGYQEIRFLNDFGEFNGQDDERFTCYVHGTRSIIHFPRVPRCGDIFCSKRFDNVLILDIVTKESPQEHHTLPCSGDPRDRDLYRVHHDNGVPVLQRMGHENFIFHEEKITATYYISDKDIALHFTSVPRDGDIFCSQRNGNVLILEALPMENSQEHHNKHPRDMDLYRVCEENGGFLLMKRDNNMMPTEESYFFGQATQEENSTFTYYLPDKDMACHFTRLPTHNDIFHSRRRNNIMILDVVPGDDYQEFRRSYGSPWDTDWYRVKQRDDGFELVMVTYSPLGFSVADGI